MTNVWVFQLTEESEPRTVGRGSAAGWVSWGGTRGKNTTQVAKEDLSKVHREKLRFK